MIYKTRDEIIYTEKGGAKRLINKSAFIFKKWYLLMFPLVLNRYLPESDDIFSQYER